MTTRLLKVQVLIVVEADGAEYYAYCPELRGVHVFGETVTDAVENAKDAAIVYLQSLINNDEPLPLCVREHRVTPSDIWNMVKEACLPAKKDYRIEELSVAA